MARTGFRAAARLLEISPIHDADTADLPGFGAQRDLARERIFQPHGTRRERKALFVAERQAIADALAEYDDLLRRRRAFRAARGRIALERDVVDADALGDPRGDRLAV